MSRVHLAAIDLNLLVVLRELLRTASTTRTAKRLGRTQSAVSHALARLRALLDDPLFVRVGASLKPTTFAESLAASLDEILARAESLFAGRAATFDPATLTRTFLVGSTDYTDVLILPALLARLRVEAPNVDLVTRFVGDELERLIQARELDVAIATRFRASPSVLFEPVADQELCVLVRRGHAATRGRFDLERFLAFDHALVAPRGTAGGVVDEALNALDRRRRVALRVPHFIAAAMVVARSDLITALPRAFAELMAREQPLAILPLPLRVPAFHFSIAYAATTESDPAQRWFRRLYLDVAKSALGPSKGERVKPRTRGSAGSASASAPQMGRRRRT